MTSLNSKCAVLQYLTAPILTTGISLAPSISIAKVSGSCGNCHTMHNSQNGSSMVHSGTGAGWNNDGELVGGSDDDLAPRNNLLATSNLLVSDCVGCHSSTTDATIVTLAGNNIPIVFNLNGYPMKSLAGGNFYQVSQGEEFDGYGHNVYGISAIDSKLSMAPGNNQCMGFNSSCHQTLAVAPNGENWDRGGCRGCHYNVYHHDDSNNHYRFLNSHYGNDAYVEGVEDAHWEHPDFGGQNYYKGVDYTEVNNSSPTLMQTHSISSYCGGCHSDFHMNNGVDNAMWIRHPTDIALPLDGEYADYNPETDYNMQAPVAWIDPEAPVREEAVVMCLSCHRVHGSEHADILRWDYDTMIAGDAGAAAGTGCFVCHTTKD